MKPKKSIVSLKWQRKFRYQRNVIVYGDQEPFFLKEMSTREPPIIKQGRFQFLVAKWVLYFKLLYYHWKGNSLSASGLETHSPGDGQLPHSDFANTSSYGICVPLFMALKT